MKLRLKQRIGRYLLILFAMVAGGSATGGVDHWMNHVSDFIILFLALVCFEEVQRGMSGE